MRKRFSKLLLVFFFAFLAFFNSAKPAKASAISDWISSIFKAEEASTSYSEAIGEINNETATSETATNLLNYINTSNLGAEYVAYGKSDEEKKIAEEIYGRGIMGAVNDGMIAMYQPPASSQTYVADLMESAHIIPEAQAQGLGFASLDPILEGWKQFRNVAYLFFVLIFLVIGFLIMFRAKIGQAAITAQQAIPSILSALVFVTFSYAIAGLMIDLMYLIMYMMAGLFSEGTNIVENNIFGLIGMMWKGSWGSAQHGVESMMDAILDIGPVAEAMKWLSSLAAATIIGIAILIGSFKIFFELLKAYISVILQIVFSPIILMMGAIPGKNTFVTWIKNLAGNLLLWPTVLLCLLVERMMTAPVRNVSLLGSDNAALENSLEGGFMPPFLIGQGQSAVLPILIGVGILLVIPEIMQQVKKAMGVSDGIFGEIAKAGWSRNMKDLRTAATYTPPVVGGAAGLVSGTVQGARSMHKEDSFSGKFNRLRDNISAHVGLGVAQGNQVSTKVANVLEGKALDPNAWENTLVQNRQDEKIEELKKKKKLLKANKQTTKIRA